MNTENPLLSKARMPGETYRLPSNELFYHNDELDVSVREAEVHVYPMTAIDEIVMKSPDMLFSGKAVEDVFLRCVPQVKKPMELLAKDVDHLLLCLRKVSFGDDLEVTVKHDCENAVEHSYIIQISDLIKKSRQIDPTTLASYTTTLENGQKVVIEPIRFGDYTRLLQSNDSDAEYSAKEWADVMLNSFCDIISSVDDITDKPFIKEWLGTIPAVWVRDIADAIENTSSWGPDFETTVVCKDCGEQLEVTAPLNPVAFFT